MDKTLIEACEICAAEIVADGEYGPICSNGHDGLCKWFALCGNAATGTTPHPVLGDVPVCDRCKAFAEGG